VHVIRGANPPKKGKGVAITAEQDVLTIVDTLARRRIGERGCTTAQRRPRLQDQDPPAMLRESRGGAESRKAATNHDRVGVQLRSIARTHNRSAITARYGRGTRILVLNTLYPLRSMRRRTSK